MAESLKLDMVNIHMQYQLSMVKHMVVGYI